MFQFLIGTVKIKEVSPEQGENMPFQFLIGTVKILASLSY